MKRGTPDHPKVLELAEALGIRRPVAVGYLELLFHFTAQYAPKGDIGRYSDKRIAAGLDWQGKPSKLIDALVAARWVDRDDAVRLVVHDWADHADRSTLQRLTAKGETPHQRGHRVTAKPVPEIEVDTSPCLASAKPLPLPLPLPAEMPTPFKEVGGRKEATDEQIESAASFPGTCDLITSRFPTTTPDLIAQIIAVARKVHSPITDEELVAVVKIAYKNKQHSPALFLNTVPVVIRNKLREAINAGEDS